MVRFALLTAASCLTALVFAPHARAQGTGQFGSGGTRATSGSSGLFGSRTVGGGVSAGQRSFGGTSGGLGATTDQQANVGQLTGNERFMRGARQPGQFVGGDAADVQSFIGAISGAGGGNRGLGSAFGAQGGRGGGQYQNQYNQNGGGPNGQGGQNTAAQIPVRTRLIVGFAPPVIDAARVETLLSRAMTRMPAVSAVGPVQVQVQNRTAVLTGQVATAHARDLAEQLARLEAGIDQVENRLTVAPSNPPARSNPATPAAGAR